MAKSRGASPRARRQARVLGAPAERALLLDLVVEMTQISHELFARFGVTSDEQHTAEALARERTSRARPSEALMATLMASSEVLSLWRRDPRFASADGRPRVLPIKGRGASLQTLVRTCAPHVPLAKILDSICTQGEVTRYKGDKVALLGHTAMMARRTPEMVLAWLLTQFRHFAESAIYNASLPAKVKGVGLFQRQVEGWLTDAQFAHYAQAIRPQLQGLCDQLEGGLIRQGRRPGGRGGAPCGVGIFVYRSPRPRRSG